MRKTVRRGGMRMTEHGMINGNGNELCGEGGMRKTVLLTALISSRDVLR
jgi:hypothetical protein